MNLNPLTRTQITGPTYYLGYYIRVPLFSETPISAQVRLPNYYCPDRKDRAGPRGALPADLTFRCTSLGSSVVPFCPFSFLGSPYQDRILGKRAPLSLKATIIYYSMGYSGTEPQMQTLRSSSILSPKP